MSEEQIDAGDLVYVKRWPCCGALLGTFHTVADIEPGHALGGVCQSCGTVHPEETGPYAQFEGGRGAPLSWVRKVPPLTDHEILDEVAEIMFEAGVGT